MSSSPATRPPEASSGARSVAVSAPTQNTVIVTGDRNTVRMELGGVGAILAFVFRWERPRARRRRDRQCPPSFADHVDRLDEIAAIVGEGNREPRVANVYGSRGIGKTHVLLAAVNHPDARARHGRAYVAARGLDADDVLHALFAEFYTCRTPRRDLNVEAKLRTRRAVVGIDDVGLDAAGAQRLVLALPRSRLVVATAERTVLDGRPVRIGGLAAEVAEAIAAQELGGPLDEADRAPARQIAEALDGHPVGLRQVFGVARDQRRSLAELVPDVCRLVSRDGRLAALTDGERRVARVLAVHAGAPVGIEHIRALSGDDAGAAAAVLERRHDAVSHSPRYSLVGALAGMGPGGTDLARALEHFLAWTAAHQDDPPALLEEGDAVVALLDQASDAGRMDDVITLGRRIESTLAWGQRWAQWGHVLDLVEQAASANGDTATRAWALHQQGTRAYGRGDVPGARRLLDQALSLRRDLRDGEGVAATEQNLRVVNGRPSWLQRASHAWPPGPNAFRASRR